MFLISVTKYPARNDLREERFILTHSSKESWHGRKDMVPGTEAIVEGERHQLGTIASKVGKDRVNQKQSWAMDPQACPPVSYFLQSGSTSQSLHNFPRQHQHLETKCSNIGTCWGQFIVKGQDWVTLVLHQKSMKEAEAEENVHRSQMPVQTVVNVGSLSSNFTALCQTHTHQLSTRNVWWLCSDRPFKSVYCYTEEIGINEVWPQSFLKCCMRVRMLGS